MAWQKSVLAVKNARSRSTTISTAGHMEPIKSSQSHKHTFSFTTPTERTLPPSLSVSRATKQALTSSHNILANSSPLRRWTLMGVELGKTLVMTQICPRLQKTDAVRNDQINDKLFLRQTQKKSIMVSQQIFLGLQLLLEATVKSASVLRPNSTSHFKAVPDVGHGNAAKEWIIICVSNGHTDRTKASHLRGITRAMDLQSLPPLKSPFPKASHPPSLSLKETSAAPPSPGPQPLHVVHSLVDPWLNHHAHFIFWF